MSVGDELYPWLVSAVGGALGAALLLVPKWGEALIQSKTGKVLEAFKAKQSLELERLKAEQSHQLEQFRERLNHLADRGRRSNEMEFTAIETVWKFFVKAWLSANTCAQAMIPIPEFEKMSGEGIKKYVASYGLSDDEQEALLRAADRKDEFVRIVRWKHTSQAEKDIYQARLTLREQRIFIPPEITKQFSETIERMSEVQVEQRLSLAHRTPWDYQGPSTAWIRDCVRVFEDMANSANKRLFREELNARRD